MTTQAYANLIGYSDVSPFEVVRKISDTTLEIREMLCVRDPDWRPEIHVGGFFGHCANNRSQRWIINSDPSGRVVRIRLTRKGWSNPDLGVFKLSDKPVRFYDYNF